MGNLMFLLCTVVVMYFGIGRAACPQAERLPLHELDHGGMRATLRGGWRALGQHSNTSRLMVELPWGRR